MRLSPLLPLVLACGCATDVASKADLRALEEQIQALQRENAQLAQRLQTVEHERVPVSPPATEPGGPATAAASAVVPRSPAPAPADGVLPALTVVKLKPKGAPPIDVRTPVQEPDAAVVEELDSLVVSEPAGAAGATATPTSADQEYQAGLEALRTGNVTGGIERLKRFAETYPRHPKADDALYYAGLGELGRGEVARAAKLFEQVVQRYPAGDVVQDAMLKLGEARVRLRQPAEARAAYAQLVQTFPGTAAAAQAQARLSTLPRSP